MLHFETLWGILVIAIVISNIIYFFYRIHETPEQRKIRKLLERNNILDDDHFTSHIDMKEFQKGGLYDSHS